jgi:hypothetical protein
MLNGEPQGELPAPSSHASRASFMPLSKYGKTLEIDHIVSLELGGSNDIANLFRRSET